MSAKRSAATGRRVLVAVAVATLAIGGLIVATIPRGEPERAVTVELPGDAVVHVTVVVEEVNAARGSMKVRMSATSTGNAPVPPEGLTVLADIEGMAPLRVQADAITIDEGEGEVRFDSGTIGAYPFDRYDGEFGVVAVRGDPDTFTDVIASETVPMSLTFIESTSGFDVAASADDLDLAPLSLVEVTCTVTRTTPVVVWVSIMMAIYWLLTAAVVSVVLVTVLGYREWETRHLAWLAAMIFAFTSFRAAAPDSPPIGVYFDFASFFWAELILAVCLAIMVGTYLVSRRVGAEGAPEVGDAPTPDPRSIPTAGATAMVIDPPGDASRSDGDPRPHR